MHEVIGEFVYLQGEWFEHAGPQDNWPFPRWYWVAGTYFDPEPFPNPEPWFRFVARWPGGGFEITKQFPDVEAALAWASERRAARGPALQAEVHVYPAQQALLASWH